MGKAERRGTRSMATTRKCPKRNVSGKCDSQESKHFVSATGQLNKKRKRRQTGQDNRTASLQSFQSSCPVSEH